MTKNGWGSEWPKALVKGWPESDPENTPLEEYSGVTPEILGVKPNFIGWDKGIDDKTVIVKIADGKVACIGELKSQGSNLVDDQTYLYFQCEGCNEILDPHTKSFAKLQEARAKAEWIVKWNFNGQGYKVYCQKCGEKM